MKNTPCPCNPKVNYANCCEPYHLGLQYPEQQEALMRSRYSAYVLQNIDYLKLTWHSTTCPNDFGDMDAIKWLGLKINKVNQDIEHQEYFVEFIARYKDRNQNGKADKIHELSRFIYENDKLVYIDGEFLA